MSALMAEMETLADLLRQLGVDAGRVRLHPPPGTATEKDVEAAYADNKRLCELVDGVLIEKAPGHYESHLASVLAFYLEEFTHNHHCGIIVGGTAFHRLRPGLVRAPGISYISWERMPNHRIPREPIPDLVPNLAIEVLRRRNTRTEMARKRRDYFDAGVELGWQIDPEERTCEVFTSPDESVIIGIDGIVVGGTMLPGFQLPLREFFARADYGLQQGTP